MVWVASTDYERAIARWQEVTNDEKMAFFNFTINPALQRGASMRVWYQVTEEMAQKVELLNGPHYKAIIKAYLIKEEHEKVD